ncbi:DNA helicase [Trifolium repens]|nr:DNA helicase [Trifolium repens]
MDWTWALFGKPGKGGISGPGLKMDLNANIGLTFTPIEWGNEQKHILSAIPQGKSVFITGSAGTAQKETFLSIQLLDSMGTSSGLPEKLLYFFKELHDTEMALSRLKATRLLLHLLPSLSDKDRTDKNDFYIHPQARKRIGYWGFLRILWKVTRL